MMRFMFALVLLVASIPRSLGIFYRKTDALYRGEASLLGKEFSHRLLFFAAPTKPYLGVAEQEVSTPRYEVFCQ